VTAKVLEASTMEHDSGTGDGAAAPAEGKGTVLLGRRLRRWYSHVLARLLMVMHGTALAAAKGLARRPRTPADGAGHRILLTGRFFSPNWAVSHLRPLAASQACSQLVVVSTSPLPPIPKVTVIYPPCWLMRLVGATPARLLVFAWTAIHRRPYIVGGFHIIVNGLVASILALLVGARSMYFCVGGPAEYADGGLGNESSVFKEMETPDAVVERRLLKAINACDVVITMGTGAMKFLRDRGVDTRMYVVPGGIDSQRFQPHSGPTCVDLILVGRLAEIKRIDLFLEAVARVADRVPDVTGAVVGEGELKEALEQRARDLGIDQRVKFTGFQPRLSDWLRQARVFVLTSRSEGLSLALMEAMMSGLPAVVSNVGDLGDLVENGVNGYLVDQASPEAFVAPLIGLLTDRARYAEFSRAARNAALRYEMEATTQRWDAIFAQLDGNGRASSLSRRP